MFDAYFIYFALLAFLIISTWLYNKTDARSRKIILGFAVAIYSIVLGLRYNVGTDYMAYMDIYNMLYFDDVEWGYALINKILYNAGLPFPAIFILVAFFQILLFLKGVEKIDAKYLPYTVFFYFTTLYIFLSLNGLRQCLAFSIFVYSINYIADKKLVKYALTILLASTIHKSALILFALYFIINNDWLLKHRFVQIGCYIITFAFSLLFHDFIVNNAQFFFTIVGYANYADGIDSLVEVSWGEEGSGLGIYFFAIIDLFIIWNITKYKSLISKNMVVAFYNLYFIGLIFANIVAGTYFERINIYFQHTRIVIYALFFYSLFKYDKSLLKKGFLITVIAVFIVFFYMGISNKASNGAPFQFV